MIVIALTLLLIALGYAYGRWRDEREINRMIDRYFGKRLDARQRMEVRLRYFGAR